MSRFISSLRRWLRGKLFKQETGFLLNYLTLDISSQDITNQVREHRAAQFTRLIGLFFLLCILSFLYNLFLFITKQGHPLLVVTSGITLAGYIPIFYLKFRGMLWKATYLCVPYLLVHTVASVCCYRGWLPPALTIKNKDIFDFQILVNFLIINALPLIEFRWTLFGMVPTLLIGTYMQVTVQARDMYEIFMYLPEEVKAKHRQPAEMVYSTMYRTLVIGAMFILAHYL